MSYKLAFLVSAKKEWDALDNSIKEQFKKKLEERLLTPHVEKDCLYSMKGCYKIKLRSSGYRLVYKIEDKSIRIVVIAIGKRERNKVYKIASKRI